MMVKTLGLVLLVVFNILCGSWVRRHEPPSVELPEQFGQWDPRLFQIVSFGHLPAVIDWIWMRTLLDPGIAHVPAGVHPPVFYRWLLVSELDPLFFEVYTVSGNVLAVIRDDDSGAEEMLLRGERVRKEILPGMPAAFRDEYWGDSWRLPLLLSYVYLFEMDDLPRASVTFKEAAEIPGSPEYLDLLVEKLKTRAGQFQVGMKLLTFMISREKRDDARKNLEEKRRSLFLAQHLHYLNELYRGYRGTWREFVREYRVNEQDPWGGRIYPDEEGKIVSTTPHQRVMGLE